MGSGGADAVSKPFSSPRPLCESFVRRARLDLAGHVDGAAHGRLDLAVALRALGDLNRRPIVLGERVVHEFLATLGTGHVYAHPALSAGIRCHSKLRSVLVLIRTRMVTRAEPTRTP